MLSTNNKMSTNLIAKNMKKFLHHRNAKLYWKYMSSISQFINNLCGWIYYILYIFFLFWNQNHSLWLALIRFHSFSFVVPLVVIRRCHSLLLIVIRCHSLSLVAPRVATCSHSLYQSLPFVVTRCHLLSLVVALVVTRRDTGLSFYKRSYYVEIRLNFFCNFIKYSILFITSPCQTRSMEFIFFRKTIFIEIYRCSNWNSCTSR